MVRTGLDSLSVSGRDRVDTDPQKEKVHREVQNDHKNTNSGHKSMNSHHRGQEREC